jgi:hypothetical protein
MATQGFRANESEFLRSLLDQGRRCNYEPNGTHSYISYPDEQYPAIHFQYSGYDLLFIDHENEFQLSVMEEDYPVDTIKFSYDHYDKTIEMFFISTIDKRTGVYSFGRIYGPVSLGNENGNGDYDAGSVLLDINGCREIICNDLIYMFDDIDSYVNKIKQVVERMNAESEEFNKDRFIELMTEKRCKSARK